jgi:hypothetical protein
MCLADLSARLFACCQAAGGRRLGRICGFVDGLLPTNLVDLGDHVSLTGLIAHKEG